MPQWGPLEAPMRPRGGPIGNSMGPRRAQMSPQRGPIEAPMRARWGQNEAHSSHNGASLGPEKEKEMEVNRGAILCATSLFRSSLPTSYPTGK